MTRMWWLASYPKSGSTWLRMFLSAYRGGGSVDINRPAWAGWDDVIEYFYRVVSPVALDQLGVLQTYLLRPAALMHMAAAAPPGAPLLVKTHFANCTIAGIEACPAILSHGAVYVVRDPRDVAVSFAAHRGTSVDEVIEEMGRRDYYVRKDHLAQHLASWSDHARSWSEQSRFPVLVVRYEDMVADAEAVFRAVLRHLRHEIDEDLLRAAVAATSLAALRHQEEESGFREKTRYAERFFGRGEPGAWRGVLSPEQSSRVEADHGSVMRGFGYLPGCRQDARDGSVSHTMLSHDHHALRRGNDA